MIPIIEDAILGSDLDCQGFTLRNIRHFYPVPPGLVDIDDPRLNDSRVPPDSSITNEHISATAGIEQLKLDLSRGIPGVWLGNRIDQAAPGNLVERLSNKGAANGYAPVDSNLKLLASNVAPGAGLGTVNSVRFSLSPELLVTPASIETSGTFMVTWANVPDNSYLGTYGISDLSGTLRPAFITGPLPDEVIPAIDASKFTSGVFPVESLPVAIGMDAAHTGGILPTPGEFGDPTQYLGRDMQWHHFDADKNYQPTLPTPVISLNSWSEEAVNIFVDSVVPDSVLFYRLRSSLFASFFRAPGTHIGLIVPDGDFVEAYSAKPGYNNSNVSTYIVATPLSEVT